MPDLDSFQLDLFRDLVAVNTVNPPGNERKAAELLGGLLKGLGFAVELQEVRPDRANVVASLRGGPGPEVVLCGHLDVVAADPSQWRGNPFVLRHEGTRFYGRGACDMKGAISCMVAAARDFVAGARRFNGTLTLLFVADEEVDAAGARRYVSGGGKPDMVVIGEPTRINVCVAHRGVSRYHLDITGRSGHAARPAEALNPIPVAGRLAALYQEHNERLALVSHPILPPPTVVVTMIAGGEQPNTVPGRCRVTVDRRVMPGEDREAVAREAEEVRLLLPPAEAAMVGKPDFFVGVPASQPLPGSTLGERCRSILAGMGIDAAIRDFPASCDQFAFIGGGIDCLLVGPGDLAQAHTADEYVESDQLVLAREFYLRLMKERLT